ncbi:MAG: c-type cytochrome [Cyclobacteriaceae bacterium]
MKALPALLISLFVAIGGCGISQSAETNISETSNKEEVVEIQGKGYELMKSTCYACHNPNTKSHDEIIAPPHAGIKMRYLRRYRNREDFIKGMSQFLSNPSEESALMRGAVGKFGLMPKLELTDSDIQLIVEFIYDNKLEEPDWFAKHSKEMHGN